MCSDEPIFPADQHRKAAGPQPGSQLVAKIRGLLGEQLYGVLCTQGQGQPYGSIIAFAYSEDLSTVVFSTPTATRKYRLLSECNQVALVVDNRPQHLHDMMKVEALTATGRATAIQRDDPAFQEHERLLVDRHPQLKTFFGGPSCALFRIDVVRFFHVSRFQEVGQWAPPSG